VVGVPTGTPENAGMVMGSYAERRRLSTMGWGVAAKCCTVSEMRCWFSGRVIARLVRPPWRSPRWRSQAGAPHRRGTGRPGSRI